MLNANISKNLFRKYQTSADKLTYCGERQAYDLKTKLYK